VLLATDARAFSSYLTTFSSTYPASTTDNAGCVTCHGTNASGSANTGTFNRYGAALRALSGGIAARLVQVEGTDSDGEGNTNRQEINANAQPGWCAASRPGCNNGGFTLPTGITLLDPAPANQAPTANPGGPYSATVGIAVRLDGSRSADPDGSIASYAWNFGNGSAGSGVSPSVTYASAGTFTVTLTVNDNSGATSPPATTSVTVSVGLQPPVANAGGPYTGSIGVPVAFTGTGSRDPDGSIVSYAWNFGDGGSGSGPIPTHTYATAGTFTVTLTVTDNDNLTNAATASVNITDGSGMQPPVANPGGPYTGTTGRAISFDGSASRDPDGTIVSHDWSFGDGGTASGPQPLHAYATADSYTVTLRVTDDTGRSHSASTTAVVTEPVNQAPTANPGGPYSGTPGSAISFNGSGSSDPDGNIVSWDWNFGDGSTGSGATPAHTYAAAGEYTVTLVVTDNSGARSAMASTRASIRNSSSGESLYTVHCADCHGDPWGGPALDARLPGTKRVAGARACTIEGAIFGTRVFPNGVPDMVAYGNQGLSAGEIAAVADFLNSREATGEQRYVAACAGCHGNDARGGRVSESVRGEDAGDIREAIREERDMHYLSCVPANDVDRIGTYLDGIASSNPPADDDSDGGGGGAIGALSLLGLALLALGRFRQNTPPMMRLSSSSSGNIVSSSGAKGITVASISRINMSRLTGNAVIDLITLKPFSRSASD
jgi:PKD repeat protein